MSRIVARFSSLPCKRFLSSKPYDVLKGRIKASSDDFRRLLITIKDSPEILSATLHPSALSVKIRPGSLVFVSKPCASDPSRDEYEIIAAPTNDGDGMVTFTKFTCVHPEKLYSTDGELCGNCPLSPAPK
jgi:hypothetical protein